MSRSRYRRWSGDEARVCAECKRTFFPKPGADTQGLYCSRECACRVTGRDGNARKKTGKRSYVCAWCSVGFESYYKNRRFCSAACSRAGTSGRGWRGGKKDANHDLIVAVFERQGCRVVDMHFMGGGFPDLLVSYGNLVLRPVEIKNPKGNYGKAGLNKNQRVWAAAWKGGMEVVYSEEDAIRVAAKLRRWDAAIRSNIFATLSKGN